MTQTNNTQPVSRRQRLRELMCKWVNRSPILFMLIMFVTGILFWGGFNTAMEMTNNEGFCISCHEMKDNVYREYRQTIHYSNRTGVRATCPDCHVPREWTHMFVRKVSATNELYHKIAGSIDTQEKFTAKRLQLAGYVWDKMKGTDSRECRNCHANEYMNFADQGKLSQRKHTRAVQEGLTCIDCHMGIAHSLPRDFDADGALHAGFKQTGRPCGDCHKHLAQSDEPIKW